MKKISKRIAVAFATFFGALIIAGFVLPPFMDWNKYRGQVEAIASSILDEQVKVDGDVALRLLPSPEVTASSVRIISASGDEDIATVDTLHIRMDTLALLGGKMAVSSLELTAPKMTMRESEGIGWHVQGFEPEAGENNSKNIRLNNVLLRGGVITLLPLGGGAVTLDTFDIDFSGQLPLGPMDGLGSFNINDVPVNFEARLLPMSDGKSQSLRFVAKADSSELEITGRIMTEGRFNGRLKVKAETVSGLANLVASMQGAEKPTMFPNVPLFVDVRVDTAPGRIELDSRRVQMGESEGRLNLLVIGQAKKRFSGALALGSIDMDLWNFAASTAGIDAPTSAINWPETLSGVLDVTAEALTWHGQLVRQVDISLEMTKDRLLVEKAQALVPGGGELSLGGESAWGLQNPMFIGRAGMKSGRFRDFLTWWGMDISRVPDDKVMSITWRSELEATFDNWAVDNINAVIDDSRISGKAAGHISHGLTALDIAVDSFNYDAYQRVDSSESEEIFLPAEMKINIQDLTLYGLQLSDTVVAARKVGAGMMLDTLEAKLLGGVVVLNGSIDNIEAWAGIKGDFSASNLSLDALRNRFDALRPANKFFTGPVAMEASFTGNLNALVMENLLILGDDQLKSTATLNLTKPNFDALSALKLNGEFDLKSSAKVLENFGFEPLEGAGKVILIVEGKVDETLNVTTLADFSGADITFNGQWIKPKEKQDIKGDFALAVPEGVTLIPTLNNMLGTAPLSFFGKMVINDTVITVDEITAQKGEAEMVGNLSFGRNSPQQITGAVTLSNVEFENAHADDHAKLEDRWRQTAFSPLPLRSYFGGVDLTLDKVSGWGQSFTSGKGLLSFDDNGIGFALGEAILNGSPANIDVRVNEGAGESLSLSMDIDAANLNFEQLSASLFGPAVKGATGAVRLKITGNGRSEHALVKTLRGEGSLNANAGMLRFMDAPKLIRAINSTDSRGAFVLALPQLLDKGYSDINSLTGTFTVDRGVVTLAPLTAKGSWGILSLPGTLDIANRSVSLKGQVKLIDPIDLGALPISFEGPVTAPKAKYDTLALIRFADAAIGRRMRTKLAEEQKQALDDNGGEVEPAGKLLNLIKKVLKDAKEKDEPSDVEVPEEQTP